MKLALTALLGTAAIASGDVIHYFSNDDIAIKLTVQNDIQIDDTKDVPEPVHGAKMQLEVLRTAPEVRLNSIYFLRNHATLTGEDAWQRQIDPEDFLNNGAPQIRSFDLYTDDFNNSISPDANPFGSWQTNPAFRPYLYADEGRGSYNFSDRRQLLQDLSAENFWFDQNVDGGDQWFIYHDTFRNGSGSIGEWTFQEKMSIVYSKSKGSTTHYYSTGNFTDVYNMPDPKPEEPSEPEEPNEPEEPEFNFTYKKSAEHTHRFTVTSGFTWTLQASTNLRDWTEVDSPFVAHDNGDGTTTFTYTRQDKVKEFFRFIITDGVDLVSVASEAIDNAIASIDPNVGRSIFNSYTSPTELVRNPSNFLNNKEGVTGLVAWNSRTNGKQLGGFAITPQHVLCTLHASYAPGDVVYFVTDDSVVISRTITHTKGTGHGSIKTDFVVCLLDNPLPSTIEPLEIMPADSAKYFANKSRPTYLYDRFPMVWVNQSEEVVASQFKEINWVRNDDPNPDTYTAIDHAQWRTDGLAFTSWDDKGWNQAAIAGDSGSVSMMIIDNKLVACGLYSDEIHGPWLGQLITINDLKRLIVDVDAKAGISTELTLTEADLSNFNDYSE